MSNFCVIIPQVFNKDGESVDSKLFTDLLAITGDREATKAAYTMVKSDNFKNWFGDSKFVDENGEPKLAYHGSHTNFDTFIKAKTNFDHFFFTTSRDYSKIYGKSNAFFLNITNPVDLMSELKNLGWTEEQIRIGEDGVDLLTHITNLDDLQNQIRKEFNENADGIIANDTSGHSTNMDEIIVFEPNQIKSIFNNGEFSSLSDNTKEDTALDPVQQYMQKNKIAKEGLDYRKAKYGSKNKKLHEILKELREKFPNYNIGFRDRSDGGYRIVHTAPKNLITKDNGGVYFSSQEEMADHYESKSIKEILEDILISSKSPMIKETAQLLIDNLHKIDKVSFRIEFSRLYLDQKWGARYFPDSGLIELNGSKVSTLSKNQYDKSLIHELIHAFTMSALNKPTTPAEIEFQKTIEKVYEAYKNSEMNNSYGLTDQYEFVAEIMANPAFVNELGRVKPSLLDKFLQALRKLLKIKDSHKNLNSEIRNIMLGINDFIENDANPELIEGAYKPLNDAIDTSQPYYVNGGMAMQHSNIDGLSNGDKRLTIRPTNHPDGTYTFGGSKFKIMNRYGKKVGIADVHDAARLKTLFKGEMGFDETNPKFQHITDWFNGIGEMYIYQIQKLDDRIVNLAQRHVPTATGSTRTKNTGVTSQINEYTSQRINDKKHLSEIETVLLHIHKKVRYDIGKLNKEIQHLAKDLKDLEFQYKKNKQPIIDGYVVHNGGVYDTGFQNAPAYKALTSTFDAAKDSIDAQVLDLEAKKTALNSLIVDLPTVTDITLHKAQYLALALDQLTKLETATYDLDNTEDQSRMAEDYNFAKLIAKSEATTGMETLAKTIAEKLMVDISTYIANLSNTYLNTSGLENPNIDITNILEVNDDIILLERWFTGFGDYPRLEAQLIHAITVDGKQKARYESIKVGQKIMEHLHKLQKWGKENGDTNMLNKGSIRKVYARLMEVSNTGRLDLVKPFTKEYYRQVSAKFKEMATATPVEKTLIKQWLRDNYYTKPTSGTFMNPKYQFLEQPGNESLKEFYDFFKETVREGYSKLPDYIHQNNEEKIPSLMKESFWEFFTLREEGIMRSIWLAGKTILFGHGHVEMYDEAGNPKNKFELEEFNNDNIRMRMVNEISADKKSMDLATILYEFASFTNDYAQMNKVLPKVRMIQNIVQTKKYNTGIQGALTKIVGRGGTANITSAIDMYIDSKVIKNRDHNWLRIPLAGSEIVDNNGEIVGQTNFYASDLIRQTLKYIRLLYLGFNPFSAFSNVSAGLVNDLVEASGGQYFNKRQLMKAIVIYGASSLKARGNKISGRADDNMSKLALLSGYIQPLQEIGEYQDKRKMTMPSATLAGQGGAYVESKTFVMQEWGEDFVQKITMIAYLLNKKTNGKSHWSLFSVQNNQLVWDDATSGIKYDDIVAQERAVIVKINQELHGNYSKDNSSVYDGQILYQAAILFRKWLPAMVQSRIQARRYDFSKGKYVEGRFRTVPKYMGKLFSNLIGSTMDRLKGTQDMLTNKKEITKDDIIAVKKTIADIVFFLMFTALGKYLLPPPDEEEMSAYKFDWWEEFSYWDDKDEFADVDSVTGMLLKTFITNTNKIAGEAIQMYNMSFYNDLVTRHALIGLVQEQWQMLGAIKQFLMLDGDDEDLRIKSGVNEGELHMLKETRDLIPYYKQVDKGIKMSKKTVRDLEK